MADINTPALGESVTEATVARWTKKVGEAVKKDEILVELETDKVSLEVASPADGVLSAIGAEEGATVVPGTILGVVTEGATASAAPAAAAPAPKAAAPAPAPAPAPAAAAPAPVASAPAAAPVSPAPARVAAENNLDLSKVAGTGKDGRVTKGDALAALEARASAPAPAAAPAAPRPIHEREERVKMTRLRQTIARRLKEAQNTAAMLTTFNEVDMSAVMALRAQYKDVFEKRHGVKLGFMSFFTKAVVAALKAIPDVNAEIDGTDIVYKNHYDIGVAVGTDKGLVVPVVRDADALNLAEIEKAIGALGKKARDGQLSIEDMQGGTFTITNGGIYGSLMSTPILNAPQSGILGMHAIKERAMVVNGKIEIRPMMYLALSYDHRVVDGAGAVTFLVKVKEALEDPQRLLLDL
ncbi:2-oxoglutarate dehydrogenase complex dihydrolipoyllysine-residue succinyltransferase [Caulobacter sp. FWC2]|uniref:2-oxoglutarate dehydrogenase complex dihydrolipoyllysine-residue succinyltransferase n=1 Tax=Caulobacter sp. FWC2 TaxID=69664 RepID=UPI000C14E54E|nr:2-oxoglutarate dehydrogenase complex dihydrolipoyllysine-residue succinyltransferase [Caulobacter sp. FWC2]PIB94085.1 dihydrolipoyllysine-residue succinyltransferase [Caulobacter sp. FWC2]